MNIEKNYSYAAILLLRNCITAILPHRSTSSLQHCSTATLANCFFNAMRSALCVFVFTSSLQHYLTAALLNCFYAMRSASLPLLPNCSTATLSYCSPAALQHFRTHFRFAPCSELPAPFCLGGS